ncbi:CaiB/BaiF CoA transferase family protein [Limnobacter litoralis]|uniref:CoA transferase n=1 Tax=Limnobacter litoralis TaxID=481366 RepID=A0ABQ5YV43_9BURK|nr:CaiB/BaiF CoA-transferase family protein [Limnobacter litoralis]GLR27321.1 CoA transferase [Limnobacter litoralis]
MAPIQDPTLLAGITVLDLSRNLPGPATSLVLQQMGATVIKLEPPHGDDAKSMPMLYEALNSEKAIVTADFRTPEGIQILKDHAAKADVLIDGFRPGVMADMGCGYDTLKALNPRLVMCCITGYGQQGNLAEKAGHDINYMALSGVLHGLQTASGDLPVPAVQFGDLFGGTAYAVQGILAALLKAQRTGQGSFVDISMTHNLHKQNIMPDSMEQMWIAMTGAPKAHQDDLLSGGLACYNVYRTQDDRFLAVGSLEHRFWKVACEAMGKPEWADIHWSKGVFPGTPAAVKIRDDVKALIASQPLSHWEMVFGRVDACVTPVLSRQEIRERGILA